MSAAGRIPRDLRYTSNHGWVRLVDGEHAVIGITCHAQDCLRGILSIELPYVGKFIRQNETVATVETAKTAVEILSPLSGEILSVNTELRGSPLLLGRDPYGEGWIAKLRV
ncbi:MAG: glycine cleavage system protein H, partial [Candidatus Bathyarchaeia archaeon]